jgi:CubicO group peptidase (beta-lactamase class C family)
MKHFICQAFVSISTVFVIMTFLNTEIQAEQKDCIDVSGTWDATDEIDASNCGGAIRTARSTYELVQNGCIVTVKKKGEKDVQAEVRGNKIYWPKRKIPGRQVGSTVILEEGVSQVSGNKATGKRQWTWTKGLNSCSGTSSWIDIKQQSRRTKMPSTLPSQAHRDKIIAGDLWGDEYKGDGPVHNDYFMPFGDAQQALHEFSGTLTIESAQMFYDRIWATKVLSSFPELKLHFFTYQNHLVPIERNMLLKDKKSNWYIVLAAGRIWSEPGDKGYSRASFPFTLVHYKMSQTHNGLATFLFNDKHVSGLRFQIVQEADPGEKFDAWGQADMRYMPLPLQERIALTKQFVTELAQQPPIHSWTELEQTYDPKILDTIDGIHNRENITLSGLIIDDVVYARPCRTRYGDYPYCGQMRHGVYSISKSFGAMLSMLRLARKYGDGVFDLRIKDYVDIDCNHQGWDRVTFGDALNMATGIGDIEPSRVSSYVSEDSSAIMRKFIAATTTREKLKLIASIGNYPWDPGEVFRYRTIDTFILAMAMDQFIKRKEGAGAHLWDLITREVLQPIGITHLPVLHTIEADGAPGIPKLEGGMLPNLDDLAKLVKLLRNGGRYKGVQILSATKLEEALGKQRPPGLPTGWLFDDGEVNYHMSLWQHPYKARNGCFLRIPAMSGHGGNYVIFMPNNITAFRFADGPVNNPATYDSTDLRKVADYIRPLCNKSTD